MDHQTDCQKGYFCKSLSRQFLLSAILLSVLVLSSFYIFQILQ